MLLLSSAGTCFVVNKNMCAFGGLCMVDYLGILPCFFSRVAVSYPNPVSFLGTDCISVLRGVEVLHNTD